jgi:hypothetical protein
VTRGHAPRHRIKDADHRVVHDVKNVGFALQHLYAGGLLPFFQMFWFTFRIGTFLGWKVPVAMAAYFIFSVGAIKLSMPDYKALYKQISTVQARFTFVHTRCAPPRGYSCNGCFLTARCMKKSIRTCAESIAFFAGDDREAEKVNVCFTEVMDLEWRRNYLTYKFRVVEDIFRQRVPDAIKWLLLFGYAYYLAEPTRKCWLTRARL